MSKKPVEVLHRWISTPTALADALDAAGVPLVATERTAHLSAHVHGTVHVLSDVAGRQIDVLVCGGAPWGDATWVIEVARKTGKYSGDDHWRLTVRPYQTRSREVEAAQHGPVEVVSTYDDVTITLGEWSATFRRLRATLDTDRLDRIVRWHVSRYFLHLDDDEVSGVSGLFEAEAMARMGCGEAVGLADANRLAERLLYRASRDAGWRKLTLREQHALGLVGGHWWREERIAMAREMHASGCGEATLAAASGDVCGTSRTWGSASAVHVARRPQEPA